MPVPNIRLTAPGAVEIRTLDDTNAGETDADETDADETEVKTLAADVGDMVRKARAEAEAKLTGGARAAVTEADAPDDSVTTTAPVAPAQGKQPGRTGSAPVIRISSKSLMPQSTEAPSTDRDARRYDPDEEESVTARGQLGAEYRDDSVTAQSPNVASAPVKLHPAIEGETEGTTKRLQKKSEKLPADEEQESITAAAPGQLANMLRVIASPNPSDAGDAGDAGNDDGDEDDDPGQRTQVMANAPLKPSDLGSRRGGPATAAAPQLEPTSESGLRVATPLDPTMGLSGDRASLGALGVPAHERRVSNMRQPIASEPGIGPSPSDGLARSPFANPIPMPAEPDRKPPYAIIVGIVALVSIAIPVVLFLVLSQSGPDGAPRVTSQPSPDPVGVTGPRPRAKAPATSPSNATGNNNRRGPFRR